jgi:hypothetical protein
MNGVIFHIWELKEIRHTPNRKRQDNLNSFYAWLKYNKHNP